MSIPLPVSLIYFFCHKGRIKPDKNTIVLHLIALSLHFDKMSPTFLPMAYGTLKPVVSSCLAIGSAVFVLGIVMHRSSFLFLFLLPKIVYGCSELSFQTKKETFWILRLIEIRNDVLDLFID